MALAVGVVGPLGPERAVGGIGSIRSSRHAPRPVAARKAGVSKDSLQRRLAPPRALRRTSGSSDPESGSPPQRPCHVVYEMP
jgi:hypothetical protein